MFKCLHLPSGAEIIILSPNWLAQPAWLRQQAGQDALVCPGCRQPVRLRTGQRYRWHFAHKHLQNCPYAQASPLLLECRASLYRWLVERYGPEAAGIEQLLHPTLPRLADCSLNLPGAARLAFWIIDTRLPPAERQALQDGFALAAAGSEVRVLFAAELLRPYEREAAALILTTTERCFMQPSALDRLSAEPGATPGGTLHYLDPAAGALTTYRGLHLVHSPQIHAGELLASPLDAIELQPERGEILHPGEAHRLAALAQAEAGRKATLQAARQRFAAARCERPSPRPALAPLPPAPGVGGAASLPPPPTGPAESQAEAVCLICGQFTRDWWYFDRATGRCKCRECLARGFG